MQRILKLADIGLQESSLITPGLWTAIIPAAGQGRRLGGSIPKALRRMAGKPLIEHVTEKLSGLVSKMVVVIAPQSEALFKAWANELPYKEKITFAKQEDPRGTTHAVLSAQSEIKTRFFCVQWADHFSIQKQSILWTMAAHQKRAHSVLTFPTAFRKNPYIEIVRDHEGTILGVNHARSGEIKVPAGENDCGFFCFSVAPFFRIVPRLFSKHNQEGSLKELNLLSLFPNLEGILGEVQTLQVAHEMETFGINTETELNEAEAASESTLCPTQK